MSAENSKGEAEQSAQNNPASPVQESTGAKTPPTGKEQNNSQMLRILKEPQWWQAFAAAVLVPVGAYALWIYGGRLDEMRKATQAALESIKLTRESAHLDQRAWVGTIAVEGQPKVREVMRFQVTIKNSGKTFARKMRVSSCGYTRESALGPPPFEIDETGAPYLQPDASSVLMMPEQTTTTEYVLNNAAVVSDTFLDDLKNGAKVVWLHGRIMYEDIFGCPHWTKFCYKMDRAFGFGVCKEDNEDDDNLCR